MPIDLPTLIGFIGTGLLIVAYFGSQQGWLRADDWRFPASNLVGSALILVSLMTAWNLPSVVIEGFWSAISLYGLVRSLRRRRERIQRPPDARP